MQNTPSLALGTIIYLNSELCTEFMRIIVHCQILKLKTHQTPKSDMLTNLSFEEKRGKYKGIMGAWE